MNSKLTELQDYVRAPDASFSWRKLDKSERITTLDMVSQTWHPGPWRHSIVITAPRKRISKGCAILYITGGGPNPLDQDEAFRLADQSGVPVVHLFDIPNQPLFGLSEDDLIAETFLRYLETGDPSWPLLMPMVKSAVRAMDGVQEYSSTTENPISKFVVTGASKRGWTAWLTAAVGDARVIGTAPMVYDNLNVARQLEHQVETWNSYSDMIEPYIARGLHSRLGTPEGHNLATMVDPYTYRETITVPKMVITGSNDPYWSADSTSLYWEGLLGPKWARIVPNAGHGLGDMVEALEAIAALTRFCLGKLLIPQVEWTFESDRVSVRLMAPLPDVTLWVSESTDGDFRDSKWWPRIQCGAGKHDGESAEVSFRIPRCSRKQAVFLEFRHRGYSTTSPTRVYG
jgi:PhoPQ-activated pathogenicity-related protein